MQIWKELQRRNVFRVAVAYVVFAWLVVQVAETLLPIFEVPDVFLRGVILVLVLGFPLAIFFAWAFELTPDGVKREKEVDRQQSIAPQTGRKLDFVIIGVLVLALSWFAWDKFFAAAPSSETASVGGDPSIAVLPFADMSPDGDQEYFSDGLSEEILNLLAQIKELKVIGRTSSFAFKGRNVDLREIGDQLGAAFILEGSVRKSGDQLRITAQLIEAEDGSHLWSESYDRRLENVFQIQDEIAGAIVDTLEVSLTEEERPAAEDYGTDSMLAYERFLEARRLIRKRTRSDLLSARGLLDESLELDPQFAPALAARAQVALLLNDTRGAYGDVPLAESVGEAKPLIDRALSANSDLASAHAVLGLMHHHLGDWKSAAAALDRALTLNPSHGDALNWRLNALETAGKVNESIDVGRRAMEIDPLNRAVRFNQSYFFALAGRPREALDIAVSIQSDFPESPIGYVAEADVLRRSGRLAEAVEPIEKALALSPEFRPVQGAAQTVFNALGEHQRALEIGGDSATGALVALGRSDEAVAQARDRFEESPDVFIRVVGLLGALAAAERHEELVALYDARFGTTAAIEAFFGEIWASREMAIFVWALKSEGRQEALKDPLASWGRRLDQLRENGHGSPRFVMIEADYAVLSDLPEEAIEKLTRAIDAGYRDPRLAFDPVFSELSNHQSFQAQVDRMIELINAERAKLDLEPLT
ncbi:tetratricopeptide repeat protein [Wenzhouxiangella sp. EGI_FJ10305]|uniref:tetratricopeptide repeat protein n=1 Tax=Wenzhouxiangella sp. EGI_FJ10305 TaxID=3243768 RepID=UPI0035DFB41B